MLLLSIFLVDNNLEALWSLIGAVEQADHLIVSVDDQKVAANLFEISSS